MAWGRKNLHCDVDRKYFVALDFLINDGVINVYDCNILVICSTTIPPKLLNKEWINEQKKGLSKNETGAACGPYSLAFIEHLITNSSINLMNDNTIERIRGDGAVGLVDKELVS
ncbi:hypothetical protein HAX54_028768 [Datura stramonium]|uniref:Ubiquitin-like protease family profile domain-containing protein n=1 Tax=Datura stramonium TaxID=4076 RepID=A0ABS8S9U7_DATST|nr:hypothetical protein [Datura stramonium]